MKRTILLAAGLLASFGAGCNRSTKEYPALKINEVMANNQRSAFLDPNGLRLDWVEIYNPNPFEVVLGGYSLTDNINRPNKYRFPAAATLPAGGFIVVFLAGQGDREAAEASGIELVLSPLHGDFGLSARQETIYLFAGNGDRLVDRLEVVNLTADASSGRYPDGAPEYGPMYAPTPGSSNNPMGFEAARWRQLPKARGGGEGELVEIRFEVAQDFSAAPPRARLRFLDLPAGCDLSASGAFQDGDILFAEEVRLEGEECVPGELPAEDGSTDGCRRNALGRLSGPVDVRILRYQGFLPVRPCDATVLWDLEVDDGIRPLRFRACFRYCAPPVTLVVNEYMARNRISEFFLCEICADAERVRTPDWFELYNYGEEPIDITRFGAVGRDFLFIDPQTQEPRPLAWMFGRDTNGTITSIAPGEHLLILADGDGGEFRKVYRRLLRDPRTGQLSPHPDTRPYFSTRFALDPTRGRPDELLLVSDAGEVIDRVVLDFRAYAAERGLTLDADFLADFAVGRFPEADFPEATTPAEMYPPDALQPGRVTACPTPGEPNQLICDIDVDPSFPGAVLVHPRCPAAGEAVAVRATVVLDADSRSTEVRILYRAGGGPERSVRVALTRAANQTGAPPGGVLFELAGEIPGQPAGTLVTFRLEAVDRDLQKSARIPRDAEDEAASPVSFRFIAGFERRPDGVRINEVMPHNQNFTLPGFPGFVADYAELHLPPEAPDEEIDLGGYFLTQERHPDDPIRFPRLFPFPQGTVLRRGEFLLLSFRRLPEGGPTQPLPPGLAGVVEVLGFNLNNCIETLHLIGPDAAGNCLAASLHWDFRDCSSRVAGQGCLAEARQSPDRAWGFRTCEPPRQDDLGCHNPIPVAGDAVHLYIKPVGEEPNFTASWPSPGEPNTPPPRLQDVFHRAFAGRPPALTPNACGPPGDFVQIEAYVFYGRNLQDLPSPLSATLTLEGMAPISLQVAKLPDPAPLGFAAARLQAAIAEFPPGPVVRYRIDVEDACGSLLEPCLPGELCFSFGTSAAVERPQVRINEINRAAPLPAAGGMATAPRPWIELFNLSAQPVDLGGMFLSHDPRQPRLARIPAGTVLPAGSAMVVITDGGSALDLAPGLRHAVVNLRWQLPAPGGPIGCRGAGTLFLLDATERGTCLIDTFAYQFASEACDASALGRLPDGTGGIQPLSRPSPGAPNGKAPVTFLRGDADLNGVVNIADASRLLGILFASDPRRPACEDVLDVDDSGAVNLSDAIYLLRFLFQQGPRIPEPFPLPGPDPTPDGLVCLPETG
jgi:hypothetical protein